MAQSDVWPAHADHVGSLLRPSKLLDARNKAGSGALDKEQLRSIEDEVICEIVRRQEAAGLQIVTDGEFRRGTYSDSFAESGISGVRIQQTESGGFSKSAAYGHRTARAIPAVISRIEWAGGHNARDFSFLAAQTARTPKITLPGPAYIHYRAGRANISRDVYPDLDLFWSDMVDAYRQEMQSLAAVGCTCLQMDETSLVKLGDERVRVLLKDRGDDWQDLLTRYIEVLNAVIANAPAGMRLAIHICRSQNPNWQASTGYDPIAVRLFSELQFNVYFLEYDNANAGTFEPLRHVPPGKCIVLGLVSSRSSTLESIDVLKNRIEEAAQFVPLDQLAISPQCGFSTSLIDGVHLSDELQWAKLARVAELASKVWPNK